MHIDYIAYRTGLLDDALHLPLEVRGIVEYDEIGMSHPRIPSHVIHSCRPIRP